MASFIKRTTAPKRGAKYYSTLNPFAGGKYDMFDKHKKYQGNCTHYVWGRTSELMDKKCSLPTSNAGTWYGKTKYKKGKTPKLGAVIEYRHKGKKTGHVAIVEEIKSNGNLVLSMSGWNTYLFKTREVKKSNNYCYSDYVLVGFIYNPVNFDNPTPKPQPTPTPEKAVYYTVVRGDTLSKIAKKYKTTVNNIMKLNPQIKDKNKIRTGEKIRVK